MAAGKKITLLLRSLERGGAERQAVGLALGLLKRNIPVSVVLFYPGGALAPELSRAGVPLLCPGKAGRWDLAAFLPRLARTIRAENPAALYSFLETPNLAAALLRPFLGGVKLVWGVRASNMDLRRYGWFPRLNFRLNCLLSRRADLIIANSFAGRDLVVSQGYPRERLAVVPNGIDTERFQPDPAAGHRQRLAWGVGAEEKLIGLVGRLDPMKDHDTFLRAAALCGDAPDLRFVCVGHGAEAEQTRLRELAVSLGLREKVVWAGPSDDMPAVYNALDLLSLASAYGEGFSNAVGEAMACGVNCVVSQVGDSALLVEGLGLAVPPGDPPALAQGWRRALAPPPQEREKTSARLRQRILENYSLDKMVDATVAAIYAFPGY